MGVNVVDTKEAELEEEVATREEPEEEADSESELVEVQQRANSGQVPGQGSRRAHRRPRANVSPRNGFDGTAFARGRDGFASASRPAARP